MTLTLTIGILSLQGGFKEHFEAIQRVQQRLKYEQADVDIVVKEIRSMKDVDSVPSGLSGVILPGGESTSMTRLLRSDSSGLLFWLQQWMRQKRPTFGTCAGAILMANKVISPGMATTALREPPNSWTSSDDSKRPSSSSSPASSSPSDVTAPDPDILLGGMRIGITRNWYGRQLASFDTKDVAIVDNEFTALTASSRPSDSANAIARFIRAPAIVHVGDGVKVLATLSNPSDHQQISDRNLTIDSPSTAAASALPSLTSSSTTVVGARDGSLVCTCFHPELTDDVRWHRYFIEIIRQEMTTTKQPSNQDKQL